MSPSENEPRPLFETTFQFSNDHLDLKSPGDDDIYDSDDEDDKYLVVDELHRPSTISQRKQVDFAIFQNWVNESQKNITAKIPSDTTSNVNPRAEPGEGTRGCSSQSIIETPREYQLDLFEKAKSKNIIVVLDTGEWRAYKRPTRFFSHRCRLW